MLLRDSIATTLLLIATTGCRAGMAAVPRPQRLGCVRTVASRRPSAKLRRPGRSLAFSPLDLPARLDFSYPISVAYQQRAAPAFQKGWAVFLDVDGTLLDFVEHPEQSKAAPRLIGVLRDLLGLTKGALALVSGRTIASVDAIFEPLRLPIAGLHGHERRDTLGHISRAPLDESVLSSAKERFKDFVADHPATFVEEKGGGIALHYRQAPSEATEVEKLASEIESQLPEPFCVQRGKMVIEIRSCQYSKGSAIEAFMNEPCFVGSTPVFIGDDATDEYGFRSVNEQGGLSIKVGSGSTAARFRIDGVGGVVEWLEDYVHFLRATDGGQQHGD